MNLESQIEHHWLQNLVGEWTYESEAAMEPGKPPINYGGTESVRSIGGLWVMCEGSVPSPCGGPATMIITLGYDPAKNRFVGTCIGSMITNLWVYDGSLDPSGKVLTLDTEGPSFLAEGKTAKYQDVIELMDDNHRTLTSTIQGEDGTWVQFMKTDYRRV